MFRRRSSSIAGRTGSGVAALSTSVPGTCAAAVLFECASCPYQGSLSAWSILSCTSTDLRKWLLEIWLLASSKKAPSAAEPARQLGVTVKTAWLMRRKTRPRDGSSRR